jgi:hypothetical protein
LYCNSYIKRVLTSQYFYTAHKYPRRYMRKKADQLQSNRARKCTSRVCFAFALQKAAATSANGFGEKMLFYFLCMSKL